MLYQFNKGDKVILKKYGRLPEVDIIVVRSIYPITMCKVITRSGEWHQLYYANELELQKPTRSRWYNIELD